MEILIIMNLVASNLNLLDHYTIHLLERYNISLDNIIMHNEVREQIVEINKLTFVSDSTSCSGILSNIKISEILNSIRN